MMIFGIHWIRPLWLLAFIPLAIFIFLALKRRYHNRGHWNTVCDEHLLPHVLIDFGTHSFYWPLIILAMAWCLTTLALAGPSWKKFPLALYKSEEPVIIAVDLSYAMLATDITPDRNTRAQFKILDLLKEGREMQFGMIAYSSEPFLVSPVTQDSATLAALVPELQPSIMPVAGHDLLSALTFSAKILEQTGSQRGQIILITSGGVTDECIHLAHGLAKKKINVSVLGMGSENGSDSSKLDSKGLRALAEAGHGYYVTFTQNNSDITSLITFISNHHIHDAKKLSMTANLWQDQGRWLILPIIPLALLSFRRGWYSRIFT